MTYELAKQLKDAGFVYKPYEHRPYLVLGDDDNTGVPIPTLSELIEVMPMRKKYHPKLINDAHFFLTKRVGSPADYRAYYEGETGEGVIEEWDCIGSTPEEAVAKLWLALNKKND